jgi:hypothetical protein
MNLFIFSVQPVATAAIAKFFKFKPSGRVLFVFSRYVVTFFALRALQNYVISRHNFLPLYIWSLAFGLRF